MATIVRPAADVADGAAWNGIAERIEGWARDSGLALRDLVVIVPFVQLLAPARRAFAAIGGWLPRIETTHTLAASLGPAPSRGSGELGAGPAHDTLLAMQALSRQTWIGDWPRRDPRGFAQAAGRVAAVARELVSAAASVPPADRLAWWSRARELLGRPAGPGGRERLLAHVALEWAARSGTGENDRLFALRPAGWVAVIAGGADPLADALLQQARVPTLRIDTDADPSRPFADVAVRTAPAYHVCDGFEDEASAAAAQVLVHVERGETPVALIAQDRALVRRIRALLERRALVLRDETGWKLATTRAGAAIMALLLAARRDAAADAWFDWLKSAPVGTSRPCRTRSARRRSSQGAGCRRHGSARARTRRRGGSAARSRVDDSRCAGAAFASCAGRLARRVGPGARATPARWRGCVTTPRVGRRWRRSASIRRSIPVAGPSSLPISSR